MKYKILIYIVTYNHENFILEVLNRIPKYLNKKYNIKILISDDKSKDNTLKVLRKYKKKISKYFKIKIISRVKNIGYGGNQKVGYKYAIKNNFDYVILLHGDGQYAPEYIDKLISKLIKTNCDAVFGSRMMHKWGALKGGMPLYKFIGNKILTYIQNKILSTNLSEFHSGYRAYKIKTLEKIYFNKNLNDYCFDTQIIIQLIFIKSKISEIPIPTYYGEEISYVNGIKYAFQVIFSTALAKLHQMNIIKTYQNKYLVKY
jgi:glycosyltransferase involved in cell wall biosynthesis